MWLSDWDTPISVVSHNMGKIFSSVIYWPHLRKIVGSIRILVSEIEESDAYIVTFVQFRLCFEGLLSLTENLRLNVNK